MPTLAPIPTNGMDAEPWAILCRHPHGPEVPQHSVTPCLVSGVRNMASGREPATQSADSQLFSGSLRQSSAGTAMRPVLAIASEPSAEPEILRRVTGMKGHPDPLGMALRARARRIHLATGIRGYGRHEAVGVRAQPFPSRPGGEARGHQSY